MRYLIAMAAIVLVVVRAIWPDLRIDEISIALLAVAALALLLPEITPIASRVRKLKLWEIEVELDEKVKELSQRADVVGERAAAREVSRGQRPRERISPRVTQLVAQASTDPKAGLLLTAMEIERAVRRLAADHDVPSGVGGLSARRSLEELANRGAVPRDVVALFSDFWQVRNQVVHGVGFDIPAGRIYELVDVGQTILELLSLANEPDWAADARTAVEHALEAARWDSDEGVVFLQPPDGLGHKSAAIIAGRVSSLEDLRSRLVEEAMLGAQNSMPYDDGAPLYDLDYDTIVGEALEPYEAMIKSLGWEL
jgi:hypothetical protein